MISVSPVLRSSAPECPFRVANGFFLSAGSCRVLYLRLSPASLPTLPPAPWSADLPLLGSGDVSKSRLEVLSL